MNPNRDPRQGPDSLPARVAAVLDTHRVTDVAHALGVTPVCTWTCSCGRYTETHPFGHDIPAHAAAARKHVADQAAEAVVKWLGDPVSSRLAVAAHRRRVRAVTSWLADTAAEVDSQ